MNIPMINSRRFWDKYGTQSLVEINKVLASGTYIGGEYVQKFRQALQKSRGGLVVPCANGTDAIELAVRATIDSRVKYVTTPFTFFATAESILNAGGEPIFVDLEPETLQLDPALATQWLSCEDVRGIVYVSLYGQPAKDILEELYTSFRYKAVFIEDAAQSFVKHRYDLTTYSFFPSKNLGSFGDGGAVVASDPATQDRIEKLANHGRIGKYEHMLVGRNSRLDAIQAAALNYKISLLTELEQLRASRWALYCSLLDNVVRTKSMRIVGPFVPGTVNQFTIQLEDKKTRDSLQVYLDENEVSSAVHYPIPLHLQPALAHLGYKKGQFPVAEGAADTVLSLPFCPFLKLNEIEYITEMIEKFFYE